MLLLVCQANNDMASGFCQTRAIALPRGSPREPRGHEEVVARLSQLYGDTRHADVTFVVQRDEAPGNASGGSPYRWWIDVWLLLESVPPDLMAF